MTTFDELDDKLERLVNIADKIEKKVAPQICNEMRNVAVAMISYQGAVDTGALRSSVQGASDIILREDDVTVSMGISTRMEYAKYIEFGTGTAGSAEYSSPVTGETYAADGVTFSPKSRWYQHNPKYNGEFGKNNDPSGVGEWIPRYAQHPRPFMRPALYDNIPRAKEILTGALKEEFD